MPNGYGDRNQWDWWRNWQGLGMPYGYRSPSPATTPGYTGRGAWGAGMPGRGMPFSYAQPTRGTPPAMPQQATIPPGIPGVNYTPAQAQLMPYAGTQGPYRTPVEQALADVGVMAGAAPAAQPAAQPAQAGAEPQEQQGFPVPWAAVEGMPNWRQQWEVWSWQQRGIPLQGYEIFRLSRGRPPWGVGGGGGGGGGGGRREPEPPSWQPGAWSWTF